MKPQRLLPVLSLSAAFVWSAALPAAASCAMPVGSLAQRLNDAPIVFVGTVDSADGSGRIANVVVESVWKGEVDERVQVQGGPADAQTITSVDRGFDVGSRYLFVPVKGNGQVFEDNGCTATQEWKPRFARHSPEDAAVVGGPPPAADPQAEEGGTSTPPEGQPQSSNLGWVGVTAAAALAAVVAVAVAVRQRGGATPS